MHFEDDKKEISKQNKNNESNKNISYSSPNDNDQIKHGFVKEKINLFISVREKLNGSKDDSKSYKKKKINAKKDKSKVEWTIDTAETNMNTFKITCMCENLENSLSNAIGTVEKMLIPPEDHSDSIDEGKSKNRFESIKESFEKKNLPKIKTVIPKVNTIFNNSNERLSLIKKNTKEEIETDLNNINEHKSKDCGVRKNQSIEVTNIPKRKCVTPKDITVINKCNDILIGNETKEEIESKRNNINENESKDCSVTINQSIEIRNIPKRKRVTPKDHTVINNGNEFWNEKKEEVETNTNIINEHNSKDCDVTRKQSIEVKNIPKSKCVTPNVYDVGKKTKEEIKTETNNINFIDSQIIDKAILRVLKTFNKNKVNHKMKKVFCNEKNNSSIHDTNTDPSTLGDGNFGFKVDNKVDVMYKNFADLDTVIKKMENDFDELVIEQITNPKEIKHTKEELNDEFIESSLNTIEVTDNEIETADDLSTKGKQHFLENVSLKIEKFESIKLCKPAEELQTNKAHPILQKKTTYRKIISPPRKSSELEISETSNDSDKKIVAKYGVEVANSKPKRICHYIRNYVRHAVREVI